jgi:hypothetical protein
MAGHLVRMRSASPTWYAAPFMPDPTVKFDYEISMGVRFGEKQWQAVLDEWIARHQEKVHAILNDFRVPLLDASGQMVSD